MATAKGGEMEDRRATFEDLELLGMAAGKVIEVVDFPRARKPSYKVRIDFGPDLGLRWSIVQAKQVYSESEMIGRLVVAVTNFPPKNIAGVESEVLILGVPAEDGSLSLLEPSRGAKLGGKVY